MRIYETHDLVVEADTDYVLCQVCKRRFNIFTKREYDAARFDSCLGRKST